MSFLGFLSLLIGLALMLLWSYGIARGFNLKSKRGWLYTACGFLAGFFIGSVRGDLSLGFRIGLAGALISLWGGPTMDRNNKGQ